MFCINFVQKSGQGIRMCLAKKRSLILPVDLPECEDQKQHNADKKGEQNDFKVVDKSKGLTGIDSRNDIAEHPAVVL